MVSQGEFIVRRFGPRQDLRLSCIDLAKESGIEAAAVVTCVGSLERVAIRFANQQEPTILDGKYEIVSLVGMFANDNAHLHISIADEKGNILGGHLSDGSLVYTTAELAAVAFPSLSFQRELDPEYGYKELVVTPKKK
jgi:predicted DNA-binding protein with PD1-like motif